MDNRLNKYYCKDSKICSKAYSCRLSYSEEIEELHRQNRATIKVTLDRMNCFKEIPNADQD